MNEDNWSTISFILCFIIQFVDFRSTFQGWFKFLCGSTGFTGGYQYSSPSDLFTSGGKEDRLKMDILLV